MRSLSVVTLTLCLAPCALGDYYTTTVAPKGKKFDFSGGESQSAVVPPGKKPQCPNGRFLVTDDNRRPPMKSLEPPDIFHGGSRTEKIVHWRNLSGTEIPSAGVSRFLPPPNATTGEGTMKVERPRLWVSRWADNHLVSLPNGNLVYQRMMATREPFEPTPASDLRWPDVTFRGDFGPGARTTNTTWLSTDCGLTFKYIGEIDSYGDGYEECALPQPLDGSLLPNFNMGGTDGPNLVVDRKSGTVFALVPCKGSHLEPDVLELSGTRVDKTYVFTWDGKTIPEDGKGLFTQRGAYTPTVWGAPAVPLSFKKIAVAAGNGVIIGNVKSPSAKMPTKFFDFIGKMDIPPGTSVEWGPPLPEDTDLAEVVGGNMQATTMLVRMPGSTSKLLLAFPGKIGGKNGFRLYRYDPNTKKRFTQLDSIVPLSGEKTAIMHLTAVDPGDGGPVLLYWTELSGADRKARVRFRVIFAESSEPEDEVAEFDLAEFDLTPPSGDCGKPPCAPYFYGDYRTAEAFKTGSGDAAVYHYFPMWVQPWPTPGIVHHAGGSVHYREVTVTRSKVMRITLPPLNDKPPERVFEECCDFMPLIERMEADQGLTTLDGSGKSAAQSARIKMVRNLLAADPNLRDPRLRVPMRRVARRQPQAAIEVPAALSPELRKAFDEPETPALAPAPKPRP